MNQPKVDCVIDVFPLFDVVTEYVKKSHFSLLWVLDTELCEEFYDSEAEDDDDEEEEEDDDDEEEDDSQQRR